MNNHKNIFSFNIIENRVLNEDYFILRLFSDKPLPQMLPGQFCQVLVENTNAVYLRRPISIFDFDCKNNTISLLVKINGKGTAILAELNNLQRLNIILPLGNPFTFVNDCKKVLMIGGGCGIAPLYFAAKKAKKSGIEVDCAFGFKNKSQIILEKEFSEFARVYLTCEDGSCGEKGNVLQHSLFKNSEFNYDKIISCGPEPMLKAVAKMAKEKNIDCEVSLENLMACGIGACLCCVNTKVTGTKSVCVDGPVFNIKELLW